ncbi:MAG: PTS sugar transporter subunit IIA [Candidatus Omnitrophica bacterium]|nr:PTS sugar transporter subunit IIA [Candidatus Omnitrophota bacterium]MCK5393217.1 PTS sugar transporter subunit IIA [Candidatus Omnitrophota bacterium]MCK5493902.1 PTS sugar transporter subunit IIA [Candidatus Omnitrophota bacterium]
MAVSEYIKEKNCIMNLESSDKDGSIKEIANKLSGQGKIKNKEKFIKDVLEREFLGSTGIGNNVAIPHARTGAVKGVVIGFGKSIEGIEFKALDGEKVNLIFLMGTDPAELNLYLRILADLSKLLMNNSFRQALLLVNTPAEVIETIKRFEKR